MSADLFAPPPPRVFRFLWIGKRGPAVKTFGDVHQFSAYVVQVRTLLGFSSVDFKTPTLAVGVCS